MTEEISGVSGSRKKDPQELQQMHQAHLQHLAQIYAARAAAEASSTGIEAAPKPRLSGDRNGTGELVDASLKDITADGIDLNKVKVPDTSVADLVGVGLAIAELGVVASLGQVAVAFSQTPFNPGDLAASLGKFSANMTEVAEKLGKLPGVGEALQVFGGVGGIVTGVNGLREQIASVKQDGVNLNNGLGAAASAARLVGGVAMALAPLCAPLAGIGGTIMLAGAALELGKLGLENREAVRAGTARLGQAAKEGLSKVVSNNGGSAPAKIVANNGANMVQVDMKQPWRWVTGGA